MKDVQKLDPVSAVRSYRDNYVNLYALWTKAGRAPEGVDLKKPKEKPIRKGDLSVGLRDAIDAWERAHPKVPLTFLKYMRIVDGALVLVVEDERPLPDEDDLVSFSESVTVTSLESASVVVEQLVASRNPNASESAEGAGEEEATS